VSSNTGRTIDVDELLTVLAKEHTEEILPARTPSSGESEFR